MVVTYGKKIDSKRLKISVDKSQSIEDSKTISTSIPIGERINSCPICFNSNAVSVAIVYQFEYVKCKIVGLYM